MARSKSLRISAKFAQKTRILLKCWLIFVSKQTKRFHLYSLPKKIELQCDEVMSLERVKRCSCGFWRFARSIRFRANPSERVNSRILRLNWMPFWDICLVWWTGEYCATEIDCLSIDYAAIIHSLPIRLAQSLTGYRDRLGSNHSELIFGVLFFKTTTWRCR